MSRNKLIPSDSYSPIFNRIINLADEKGITVTAVIKSCNISSSAIDAWKKGNIRADLLPIIADTFGCTLNYLLRGTEK